MDTSKKIRRVGVWFRGIGILLMGLAGYYMLQEKLWDDETRVLFFGGWLFVTGLLVYHPSFRGKVKYFIISTVGGFLASIGFPPSPFLPLFLVAFTSIFYLENECFNGRLKLKWFLVYVLNFFLIWNIWTTFWISNTAFLPGIVGILINAGLMTLTVWWAHWIHKRVNVDWYFGGVFIACWLSFEFIHLRWDLSWPWLTVGNALAEWPFIAQWFEYTGVLGGSFWVLLVNYLFYTMIREIQYKWQNVTFKSMQTWLIILFLPCLVSAGIYYSTDMTGKKAKTVVINPNIEPHFEKFDQSQETRWQIYKKLLDSARSYRPELILLPETIFDQINLDHISENSYINHIVSWQKSNNTTVDVLLGVSSFRIFDQEHVPERPSIRRTTGRDDITYNWEVYNSAVLIGNDTIPVYHKQRLVPGAEIFPYRRPLFFLKPIVDKLGGSIYGYGTPESQNVFESNNGIRIAPVICYESVYGEYMRKYVAQGANLLGVITNDGWWGETDGHIQHYLFSALRAIEFRRNILRSANLGYSGAFDFRGQSIAPHNEYNKEAVIPITVTLNKDLTFYAIWGDYLGRFSLMFVVFFTLKALVNTILHTRK